MAKTPKLQRSMSFVQAIRNASLDDGIGLTGEALERLRNPPTEPLCVDDPYTTLALSMFIALEHSSERTYEKIRKAIEKCFQDAELPSFHQTKRLLADLSGVTSVVKHMCINSCAAYVGPFSDLDACPECDEPRYDQIKLNKSQGKVKHPRAVFHTIPIAPQLQSLWRHPESAEKMHYRDKRTQQILQELRKNDGLVDTYDDVFCGYAYLEAVTQNKIQRDDTLLMISIDGAQLYESKDSDCWIYIWIILELSPDHRYKKKHVLPGAIIPGPKKPKIIDSFLFPGLHHVSAVQREGLRIWDASRDHNFTSRLFLFLACADGPGLLTLSSFVGHQGRNGCRMLCPLKGRRKPGASHYYPVLLKPDNYEVHGCNHPDVNVFDIGPSNSREYVKQLTYLLSSSTQRIYEKRRLETGIVGPSILLGLQPQFIQGIPEVFSSEMMHLSGANMATLWLDLWRGKFDCAPTDNEATWYWAVLKDNDVWEAHGHAVASCKMFLPGSFDVAPRDPSLHSNSWYKATEYITWIYCLCPALLYGILPECPWRNFCKFVAGLRIMAQYSITPTQLQRACQLIAEWAPEFESIFYQRRVDRIPFIRPCVHLTCHLASEAVRVGSPICSSQWTMERTIGNLGQEIRQPSDPFSNLAQQGIRRCQVNALKAMIPQLDPPESTNPRASADLGNDYILLSKRDRYLSTVQGEEARVIAEYLQQPHAPKIRRWARLRLPNGQIARSEYQELQRAPEDIRMARNVKIILNEKVRIAEVRYFARLIVKAAYNHSDLDEDLDASGPLEFVNIALVTLYSDPHPHLLERSYGVLASCTKLGEASLQVIDIPTIQSVVAMIPHHPMIHGVGEDRYFLVEKTGMEIARFGTEENNEEA
ncbi:hypothetical protein PISMIDRAFT_100434 [Pisolithus microcarpus 441]|uniref:Unplaced genomic scaffold scaffold_42, whole genome shotgun sequence n=1 Tax=Pisolithus microcarpus 441 TaxID=765257 RepID=A0A0C9ZM55_9AGAM|nr:hypothetical protein PISMIDRAFT_100434 [Pisolithus microcarpus 441]